MTTIAIDTDLVMASDSQSSMGGHRSQDKTKKIFHMNGYTIGVAGRYAEALAFLDAFEDMVERQRVQNETYLEIPQPAFEDMENFNALMIDPEGNVFLFEGSRYSTPCNAPIAIGSGSDYAYGAFSMGANAVEAVRAGTIYDVYSGGEIESINHKELLQTSAPPTREELEQYESVSEVLDVLYGTTPYPEGDNATESDLER
jgi:ATP-dependent protease HslVU (ClpYQ) peptidase subunit